MKTTDILSLLAIMLSVYTWHSNRKFQKKMNEYEFSKKLYEEHILKSLPQLRNRILNTGSSGVTGVTALGDEITELRNDMLYFKYTHKKIYENLRDKLMAFEDFLSNSKKTMDGEQFNKFQDDISDYYDEIYKLIVNDLPNDNFKF